MRCMPCAREFFEAAQALPARMLGAGWTLGAVCARVAAHVCSFVSEQRRCMELLLCSAWGDLALRWATKKMSFFCLQRVLLFFCYGAGAPTKVIGVPKTIDGDLKNKDVVTSFGFDTACKVCDARSVMFEVVVRRSMNCAHSHWRALQSPLQSPCLAGAPSPLQPCALLACYPVAAAAEDWCVRAQGSGHMPSSSMQVYSELIGNIMVDAASAGKYFHFIR